MPRTLQYIILFGVVVTLQLFMFNNLDISIYVHPMIYLAFLVLLPIEMLPVWVLLLGFLMGVTIDVGSGGAGLHSAATVFCAFARPFFLRLSITKDDMREGGGAPTVGRLGIKGFLLYAGVLVLMHNFIFFSLEASTWSYFYLTALRIVASTAATVLLIYVCQLFVDNR